MALALLAHGVAWAGAFEDGVAHYRAGNWAAALGAFQEARAAGDTNSNLQFNIGLALYRLGRLDESRREFEALRRNPRYAALADYHLGLIAAGRGDRDTAAASLRRAAQGTEFDSMRRLASVALARVDGSTRRGVRYAALGIGYDDNATLQSDDVPAAASAGDGMLELLGVIERPLGEGAPANFWLGSVYARQYGHTPDFDQQSAQLAVRHERGADRWRASFGVRGDTTFIGGALLQTAGTLEVEGRRALGRGAAALRLAGSWIEGGRDYPELTGWRERMTLEWATALTTTAYELEMNDREDLEAGGQLASRSPLRHQLSTRFTTPLSTRSALEWRGRYRFSDYRDEDRYFEGATLLTERREDHLAEAGLGWRLRLGGAWSTLLEGRYASNRSSIGRYAYEKAAGLLALEWTR